MTGKRSAGQLVSLSAGSAGNPARVARFSNEPRALKRSGKTDWLTG